MIKISNTFIKYSRDLVSTIFCITKNYNHFLFLNKFILKSQ